MRLTTKWLFPFLLAALAGVSAQGQAIPDNASVSSQPVLDAAGPKQRVAIGAVYLVVCKKDDSAGTAFLISNGLMVTNKHVIKTCAAGELIVISSSNHHVAVSQLVFDEDRDLAILKPSEKLDGGLQLSREDNPPPGTSVSTWGYPFLYNGYYPLLSVGYVAGYRNAKTSPTSQVVRHIIVNGAFNPGNSGGPLFVAQDNQVIGIVVATYHLFPEYVANTIKTLQTNKGGFYNGLQATDAAGHTEPISNDAAIGIMLGEFYDRTQVMIGEAISVSELRNFLAEKRKELALPSGR
jgi:S1-C subfamily serine protease